MTPLTLLFVVLILPLTSSRYIDTDHPWEFDMSLCILANDFDPKRTNCSIYTGVGGLVTEGNGFRVVMYDECQDSNDNFIIKKSYQTAYKLARKTFMSFLSGSIKGDFPECSKNITVYIYCDQVAGNYEFTTLIDNHYGYTINIKYDSKCIESVKYIIKFITKYRTSSIRNESDDSYCGAYKYNNQLNYAKKCTPDKFNRYVYSNMKEHKKPKFENVEL
ncbi:YKV MT-4 like protein [Murmansk poxvirus]|uniref:YKV MT-4 like protein n=1 Tax=Murmansk poxvirus TaxID=2025359 RepID=A0A223FN23_9POXV|nr:YKV MT-4 like protein [Murmansk poxvirus]AST09377.1 YKV MT-4 like protein [Murmansk poxvirus]